MGYRTPATHCFPFSSPTHPWHPCSREWQTTPHPATLSLPVAASCTQDKTHHGLWLTRDVPSGLFSLRPHVTPRSLATSSSLEFRLFPVHADPSILKSSSAGLSCSLSTARFKVGRVWWQAVLPREGDVSLQPVRATLSKNKTKQTKTKRRDEKMA